MERRKQEEIKHYNKKALELVKNEVIAEKKDFKGSNIFLLSSYKFLKNFLKNKCENKKILDYGCGNGIHSVWLAKNGASVVGIDLSENSIQIAKEEAEKKGIGNSVNFLLMDCENLEFSDNSFDIIFDGGTFSSLDLNKSFPELARVLSPDGFLIGIETLGHNPFTNFKRRINGITGKRTKWAISHIFTMEDLKNAKKYFGKTEIYFFSSYFVDCFSIFKISRRKNFVKFS